MHLAHLRRWAFSFALPKSPTASPDGSGIARLSAGMTSLAIAT